MTGANYRSRPGLGVAAADSQNLGPNNRSLLVAAQRFRYGRWKQRRQPVPTVAHLCARYLQSSRPCVWAMLASDAQPVSRACALRDRPKPSLVFRCDRRDGEPRLGLDACRGAKPVTQLAIAQKPGDLIRQLRHIARIAKQS